ncbi:MAG: CPBP family intramembrane metalloprotease [Acidobacteria bacterium]|nr:CPBP family intramembrane metalloprotease [Acidobacteriota bacterium]
MVRFIRKFPVFTFVVCCLFPVHSILWSAIFLGADPESLKPLKLFFAVLPTASALFLTFVIDGENGVKALWQKTYLAQTPIRTYIIAFGIFILPGVFALFVRWFWDGYSPQFSHFPALWKVIIISPFLLLFPGFAEEYGWRGFMLEKLRGRLPVLVGSILVGITWGMWHGMDFLMGNWSSQFWVVCLFFFYIVGVSIMIGEIYVSSGGNLIIAMLAHFSANVVNFFLPVWHNDAGTKTPIIYISVIWLCVFMLVSAKMFVFIKSRHANFSVDRSLEENS